MLLVFMGAIKQQDIENRHSSEYKKVEEMWLALLQASQHPLNGNQEDDKIFVGDTKLMLLASFGIKGHKLMDLEDHGQINEQQTMYPDNVLHYGWLQSEIDMTQEDYQSAP